ncbi:unnamed protein product, partial [marine sediment metagenome]
LITQGIGFGGVQYIPTDGLSIGEAVVVVAEVVTGAPGRKEKKSWLDKEKWIGFGEKLDAPDGMKRAGVEQADTRKLESELENRNRVMMAGQASDRASLVEDRQRRYVRSFDYEAGMPPRKAAELHQAEDKAFKRQAGIKKQRTMNLEKAKITRESNLAKKEHIKQQRLKNLKKARAAKKRKAKKGKK